MAAFQLHHPLRIAAPLVALVWSAVGTPAALAENVMPAPDASLWLAPASYVGALRGPLGPHPNSWAGWHIAQWNIPAMLPESATSSDGLDWEAANDFARVRYDHALDRYELAQNGSNGLACSTEYDLFLGANESEAYPGFPSAVAPTPPLNDLSHLHHTIGLQITHEHVVAHCAVDDVTYVTSIVLSNAAASQKLDYQIVLRDSRGSV